MLYLLLGAGAALLIWISILATRHMRDSDENHDWRSLQDRRQAVEAHLRMFLSSRSCIDPEAAAPPNTHPSAGEVYGLLYAGKVEQAIASAEEAMASADDDADARLLLAAALRAHGDLEAAASQLQVAETLGAKGSLCDYLQSQIELEQYLANSGARSQNAVLLPIEMLALELHTRLGESGDASALWLPGENQEISRDEARDFVLAHFTGYYRLLTTMIDSQSSKEYTDGLYLLGRLALKCGFSEAGGTLLLSLDSAMRSSALYKSYLRDLALLRGEKPVARAESSSTGQKVIKLKVLN